MSASLKILFITNHRRFKINFRAHPWARELAARGHDVDVMCHADTERWQTRVEQVDGFRLIENPDLLVGALRQGWDPVCALRRRNMLFRENKPYDVIHCLDTRLAVIWPALAYARAKNITIVSDWIDWWGRGGLIDERRPWWYKLLFAGVEEFFEEHYRNKLDGLSAISRALLERAVKLGVPRESCLHIPGGANLANFANIPSRQQSKQQLGINSEAAVVCFSGLDVLIDLPLAVKAFEHVHQTNPNTVLLLVGPTEKDIKDIAVADNIRRAIKTTGPIPYQQLASHLAAADVFLMPYANKISNVGRWPNKVGDYMCIGRPIVSNPVGDVRWLFEQYSLGVLADETPTDMAAATLKLLNESTNPDSEFEATATEQRAQHIAQTVFAWEKLIVNLEQWYFQRLQQVPEKSPATA